MTLLKSMPRYVFARIGLMLLFAFGLLPLMSQQSLDPYFDKFEGSVYRLPYDSLPKGYRPYVEFLVPEKKISWDSIFVRPSNSKIPFPDVSYKELFGIIFHSHVTIPINGQYEFILSSDDGSRLWIKNRLIVDNDLPHGMRVKRDTVTLKKGKYPVKIWYYQAYPTIYGIIFDANYIGPSEYEILDSIVWDSEILFDFDKHDLSYKGQHMLDSLILILEDRPIDEVKIMGHTDNVGTKDYNSNLSNKRALAIKSYLEAKTAEYNLRLTAIGYGETKPRVPNNNTFNRAKNRRVELILK